VKAAAIRIHYDDRLRNGISDSAKIFFVLAELNRSPLQLINIGVCTVPFDDITELASALGKNDPVALG